MRVFLSQVDVEANLALEFFIFAEPDGGGKRVRAGGEPADS